METATTLDFEASSRAATGSVARRLTTAARITMGLAFVIFGLNGFLNFMPQPDPSTIPAGAMAFGGALMGTGYMFPLIKGTEVLVGLLLLSNRFVPLALAMIAPVVINIVAFHAFLAPSGIVVALIVLALEVYLAWSYRAVYRPMLASRVSAGAK